MKSFVAVVIACATWAAGQARSEQPAFVLAPAVAVEAEEFDVDGGAASAFHVVKMGEGNYSVDIIGFSHAGGERFLSAPAADKTAAAHKDVTIPQAGPYRLWVRYEY